MAQVAQVADHDIVHVDDIDGIAAKLLAPLVVVIGGDAGNQNVADLVFSRPPHNPWVPAHAQRIVMAWVIVADGDNRGGNLTQPGSICGASLGRKRIGNQGDALALELKARVAKPGNFHLLPNRFSQKFRRGLMLSSPECYCTTGIGCSTRGFLPGFLGSHTRSASLFPRFPRTHIARCASMYCLPTLPFSNTGGAYIAFGERKAAGMSPSRGVSETLSICQIARA